MTFAEFLEQCREKDGWSVQNGLLRNQRGECPMAAVFGPEQGYTRRARQAGLDSDAIINGADGYTKGQYRKALLGLVKP